MPAQDVVRLLPPDPDLFFGHRDPLDVRLGSVTGQARHEEPLSLATLREDPRYRRAQVVILGCPQDEGVRRNEGRAGAREGPRKLREALYRLAPGPLQGSDLHLFDAGDTDTGGTLEEIHERQAAAVEAFLQDGKLLIILGGGNDISYPDARAASRSLPQLLAFNIDAHLDVRQEEPRNSGTPYRQLLDEGHLEPERFFEVGYQHFSAAAAHLDYLEEVGVRAISLEEWLAGGVRRTLEELLRTPAGALFWGIDLDVVNSAYAPGVSAPNPVGLSGRELLTVVRVAGGDERTRVLEISELNPAFDIDSRTARLAAAAIHTFLVARFGQ